LEKKHDCHASGRNMGRGWFLIHKTTKQSKINKQRKTEKEKQKKREREREGVRE